jgi:hypothetical protein
MRRYNLVNDIIMEANLIRRRENLGDSSAKEKEAFESDDKKFKSKDDKLESQTKTEEVKSEKELEKKIDSKKSQFKRFFGFGKQKNEDKEDIEAKKENVAKVENTEKETSSNRTDLADDLNYFSEDSEEKDAKSSVEDDFIQTFGDLLSGDEL